VDVRAEAAQGKQAGESGVMQQKKTGESIFTGFSRTECSFIVLSCGEDRTAIEYFSRENSSEFLFKIAFPQRDRVSRFSQTNPDLALR